MTREHLCAGADTGRIIGSLSRLSGRTPMAAAKIQSIRQAVGGQRARSPGACAGPGGEKS